jgi:hypothetical protein
MDKKRSRKEYFNLLQVSYEVKCSNIDVTKKKITRGFLLLLTCSNSELGPLLPRLALLRLSFTELHVDPVTSRALRTALRS